MKQCMDSANLHRRLKNHRTDCVRRTYQTLRQRRN